MEEDETLQPPEGTQQPSESLVLSFSPTLRNERTMKEFFKRNGYESIKAFTFYRNHCILIFEDTRECSQFREKFNQKEIEGSTWRVETINRLVRKSELLSPSHPAVQVSYPNPGRLTERMIYSLFAPWGFIKNIRFSTAQSYVVYETVEDAIRAQSEMNGFCIDEIPLQVTNAEEPPRTGVKNLSIPLREILSQHSPFWAELGQRKSAKSF